MPRTTRRVLLMGPMPPPDHGTSVPFRLLVELVGRQPGTEVRVVNTQSGDKAGVPLYSPKAFMPFLAIWWHTLRSALWCEVAISYGSQRFSCTVGSLSVLLLKLLGKPMHVRVAGGGFDNYYFGLAGWKRALIRASLSRAASLVVETKLVAARMAPEFSNLMTVPNWIDTHGGPPRAAPVANDGTLRFGFVAEVRADKGVPELLAAFERVREQLSASGIAASLEVVGPVRAAFVERFAALLAAQGAGVTHLGQLDIEQLIPWIAERDVLVLPTRFSNEGYPGVVLEALALGVPVIATRWRALPEIVVDGHNGLLCEPGDVDSLVAQMLRIARDAELRAMLAVNARSGGQRFQAEPVLRPLLERCGILTQEVS